MQSHDLDDFKAVMRDAREAIGQGDAYTDGALELMFAALADLDLRQVQQALVRHINGPEGKWRPNAHYVRSNVPGANWLSADEAWARIPLPKPAGTLRRPDGTVVPDYRSAEWPPCIMNQAATQAMAIAAPYIEQDKPDMNAARMAFRATYDRVMAEEKAAHRPPQYYISPGGDHEVRQTLLAQAQASGLIAAPKTAPPRISYSAPPAQVRALLASYKPKIITNDGADE